MIRDMISYALNQAFPQTAIYLEQASQIARPAFYIAELKASQRQMIGNRYIRESNMVVRYFPTEDEETSYQLLTEVADQLYACLEFLAYEGQRVRTIETNHRIEDNVLHFFLTVREPLKRKLDTTKMDHMDTEAKIKE